MSQGSSLVRLPDILDVAGSTRSPLSSSQSIVRDSYCEVSAFVVRLLQDERHVFLGRAECQRFFALQIVRFSVDDSVSEHASLHQPPSPLFQTAQTLEQGRNGFRVPGLMLPMPNVSFSRVGDQIFSRRFASRQNDACRKFC
ncbi:hypothetical protein FOMG_19796 [Fusarium oxysporum f. sp. melonis 26406]|uniref:Uncharacterized protein n=1 Tax=Fusarium oxysporum f. sp. melonis 26406 TaxID=1089452 RepID=W9YV20_FUSOX|nr:hypothetical protein FOMG_19796 [Fusarium oxysporum f. sp. melonis 26406]